MRHWLSAIIVAAGIIGFVSPSAAKVIKKQLVQDRLLLEDDAKLFAPKIN
jgi:hypothetical protein